MKLKTLGGLELIGVRFTQPKPLLLLSYLALEGPQQRRHLAELFWGGGNRMKSLSMTLTRLRQGAGDLACADDKRVWSVLESDAKDVLGALDKSDWRGASELYEGAFLEGVVLEDWSSELEEWVYTTREHLAERAQHALLNLAEAAAKKQDFRVAATFAERAYKLPGLGGNEIVTLKRLYGLLSAGSSLFAPEVRKEAGSYGVTLKLTAEKARAKFKQTAAKIAPTTDTLPMRGTSFIGRDVELTELATLLGQPKVSLLTLLGPAGAGKTRLVLQLAFEQLKSGAFKDGVTFIPLDALSNAQLIPPRLMAHLGLSQQAQGDPKEQLISAIGERVTLLILDNFEHLSEGANLLSQLLSSCPNLKLLVTSREKLRLEEEYCFPVEGLPYPKSLSNDALLCDAVHLFNERAQQVAPHFDVGRELPEVIRICQLVEGLPLGIELAAGWVRLMSCADIAGEIQKDLEFLSSSTKNIPERHRSLKAAFETSWRLLSPKEQDVLKRLSVFRGGFRREAASEVAGATIPALASLVDKSLLRVLPDGRYDRHLLLYHFTQEKLAERPDEQTLVQAKHKAFYLALAEQAEAHVYSDSRGAWFRRFDEELDNIRAVLNRATLQGDEATGLQLVTALPRFWQTRGYQQEARAYLTSFLEASASKNTSLYARGLYTLAELVWQQGEIEMAHTCLEDARLIAETLADTNALARTLGLLGRIYHYNLADGVRAKVLYERSISLAETVRNQAHKASTLNLLANLVSEQGDFERAKACCDESLSLSRALGNKSGVAYVLNNLAALYDQRGEYNQAGLLFSQSLELFRELGEKDGIAMALGNLGANYLERARYEKARVLLEESLKLARELEDERLVAYLLRRLGQVAFFQDDYQTAQAFYQESYTLYAHFGFAPGMGDTLRFIGEAFHQAQKWEKAEQSYQEGLKLYRSVNDLAGVAQLSCVLAILYIDLEKYESAGGLLLESLRTAQEMKTRKDTMLALEGFASLATFTGRLEQAAGLWGTVEAVRQEFNLPRDKHAEARYIKTIGIVRNRLKQSDSIFMQGKTVSLEEAVQICRDTQKPTPQKLSNGTVAPEPSL